MLKAMDLRRIAIDPARRKYRALFEHLQGKIVRPRGRKHAALIFLRIRNGKAADARAWIRTFAATHVTSARRQFAGPRLRDPFGSLLLSAAGYRALGAGLRLPSVREMFQPSGSGP